MRLRMGTARLVAFRVCPRMLAVLHALMLLPFDTRSAPLLVVPLPPSRLTPPGPAAVIPSLLLPAVPSFPVAAPLMPTAVLRVNGDKRP